MGKHILFKNEARQELVNGINKLAAAVGVTIGPKGRNVILDRPAGLPLITNDGVSIAKEIEFDNPYENMGAQIVKEAATKTNDIAGDGTTTATVLAHAIITAGLTYTDDKEDGTPGANPILVRVGMEEATKIAVEELKNMAIKIESDDKIEQIATISSANKQIGSLIANAIQKVGRDGIIITEESSTLETSLDVTEGYEFDRGMISPHFTDDVERIENVLHHPYILVTDYKVNFIAEIVPLLEQVIQEQRSLLIISDDIESMALKTLVGNKARGSLNVCAVKAPGFGENRKELLKDIAIAVNAEFVSSDTDMQLAEVRTDHLGTAEYAKVTKNSTLIVRGNGNEYQIGKRKIHIKNLIDSDKTSEYDKEKLRERLAKLAGGVATIKIGAATETELKEKKLRIEDAINATKAAIEEGIVPGGGTALNSLAPVILNKTEHLSGHERIGAIIIATAVSAPLYQIALNAGVNPTEIAEKINELNVDHKHMGYNAYTGEFVDMIEQGIIDPVKVTKNALINASSVASVFLTTDAAIVSTGKN